MRKALTGLLLASLMLGTGLLAPNTATAQFQERTVRKAQPTAVKAKKKRKPAKKTTARVKVTRKKSIDLLREYLPEYADLHETQSPDLNDTYVALPYDFDYRSPFVSPQLRVELIQNIDEWLGTRYRFGGQSKRGVDCSGFTSVIMSETLNQPFHGTSRWQAQQFLPIFTPDSLQFGDMVFFSGRNRKAKRIGHVGIFLGNGVFAHSSTGRGVIYSHINDGYYSERFRWGGRFTTAPIGSNMKPGIYTHQ